MLLFDETLTWQNFLVKSSRGLTGKISLLCSTDMKRLKTTTEVIDFLGGDEAVAALFKKAPTLGDCKAVANWRYFGSFPASSYVVLVKALHRQDASAANVLWNMKQGAS